MLRQYRCSVPRTGFCFYGGFCMRRQRIVDFLVYVVVRILICVVQAMRIETGHRLARTLAWLFCDVLHIRGAVVDDNLAHAFPEMAPAERLHLARADVGTPVPAGARSGPHAAENPRDQLARPRPTEERKGIGPIPAGRPAVADRGRAPGQFRSGRIRAGPVGFSHLHGRPHARQPLPRPIRQPISRPAPASGSFPRTGATTRLSKCSAAAAR